VGLRNYRRAATLKGRRESFGVAGKKTRNGVARPTKYPCVKKSGKSLSAVLKGVKTKVGWKKDPREVESAKKEKRGGNPSQADSRKRWTKKCNESPDLLNGGTSAMTKRHNLKDRGENGNLLLVHPQKSQRDTSLPFNPSKKKMSLFFGVAMWGVGKIIDTGRFRGREGAARLTDPSNSKGRTTTKIVPRVSVKDRKTAAWRQQYAGGNKEKSKMAIVRS